MAGRPRNPDIDRRALAAALELYAEGGEDRVTFNNVAARARVGNAALYRRWSHPTAMLEEALAAFPASGGPQPGAAVDATTSSRVPGRRDELIQVARDVIARDGVADFTLADVAAGAGISPPSLYSHFANRTDLLEHVLEATAEAYVTDLRATDLPEASVEERLRTRIERWVRSPEAQLRVLYEAVLAMPNSPRVKAAAQSAMIAWVAFVEGVLRDGLERGEVRAGLDVEAATSLLTSGLLGVELSAQTGLNTAALADQASQLVDMFVAYVRAAP